MKLCGVRDDQGDLCARVKGHDLPHRCNEEAGHVLDHRCGCGFVWAAEPYLTPRKVKPDPGCPVCFGKGIKHCGLATHEDGRGCGEPCDCEMPLVDQVLEFVQLLDALELLGPRRRTHHQRTQEVLMTAAEQCAGSGQRWEAGPEGGLNAKGQRRRPDRAKCPVCRKSWRQLGRFLQPRVDSPHHTVPLHR